MNFELKPPIGCLGISEEQQRFLHLPRFPARLSEEQTATVLGVLKHDIRILVKAGILQPLGKPRANATKYFARLHIEQIALDPKELDKITGRLALHWQRKNKTESPKVTSTLGPEEVATN